MISELEVSLVGVLFNFLFVCKTSVMMMCVLLGIQVCCLVDRLLCVVLIRLS